jgi:hypothetical protein
MGHAGGHGRKGIGGRNDPREINRWYAVMTAERRGNVSFGGELERDEAGFQAAALELLVLLGRFESRFREDAGIDEELAQRDGHAPL